MMKLFKLALLTLIPFFAMSGAHAAPLQEGVTHVAIVPAQPTSTDEGKIEVVEIFSYGCSHCHRFEPMLERWLKNKPDNVEFVRLPAIFNSTLALYARAFYAAEALGVLDQIHQPFFEAIHLQKRRMNSEEEIAQLFVEHGVDRDKFDKAFRSFAVEAKVRRAAELGKRYGVRATPSMVVNGKYITDPGKTNGFRGMIETVNALVEKEG
jgi:thiol:disulfide interchange protein DsbA